MRGYDTVVDRLSTADPAPNEAELPEAAWDAATLTDVIDRRSSSRRNGLSGVDAEHASMPKSSLVGAARWRGPLVALAAAAVVLVVGAVTLLFLLSEGAGDVADTTPPTVVDVNTDAGPQPGCPHYPPFLCTLPSVDAVHEAASAWKTVSVPVVRLHAVSANEVWLHGKKTSTETDTGPSEVLARGLFRLDADGTLNNVDYSFPGDMIIDSEGRSWKHGPGPRVFGDDGWELFEPLADGEQVRGELAAVGHDGALWWVGGAPDACTEASAPGWWRPMELRRWDDQGWTVWPCEALPDIIDGRVAVGPDGVTYLAGVAVPLLDEATTGFYRIDGVEFTELEPPRIVDDQLRLAELYVAPNGDLWSVWTWFVWNGGHSVFARYDGTQWDVYGAGGELSRRVGGYQRQFSIGPDNRVWVATGFSLALFDGTDWVHLLDGEPVTSVSVAPDGTIWVAIGDTVQRFPATWGDSRASGPVGELGSDRATANGLWPAVIFAAAAGVVLSLVWALITRPGRKTAPQRRKAAAPTSLLPQKPSEDHKPSQP